MIERFYLKNNLSFVEAELDFTKGLIIFSGPSGSGKSVLFDSFLGVFGLKEARAELCEVTINNHYFNNEDFGISIGDELYIKELKKEKVRYLLNNQSISKNMLSDLSNHFIKYLHIKDASEFTPANLLLNIDHCAKELNVDFNHLLEDFNLKYTSYDALQKELNRLLADENKLEELKSFLSFEIAKIEEIKPKIGEYEELQELKKNVSKRDKILEAINGCKPFFELSHKVSSTLDLIDANRTLFDSCMDELALTFESTKDKLEELDDLNIEELLDRIEKLASLQKRFGDIQGALDFLQTKKNELHKIENIQFEKEHLSKQMATEYEMLTKIASQISSIRNTTLNQIQIKTNEFLEALYLPACSLSMTQTSLSKTGFDMIKIEFGAKSFDKLSSGEFNRLRLAFLASISSFTQKLGGILFLDEIDANVSGKESYAIAKVLTHLAKTYQIFAISHQPQLTSCASQHFFVYKENEQSYVKLLNQEQRVEEISRMISLDHISEDAKNLAITLLKEHGQWHK